MIALCDAHLIDCGLLVISDSFEAGDFDPIAYINTPYWQASRLGLDRIRELLERLERPQDSLRFVHVAGTNGKGSTCSYIASILQAAGYTTGLFTSPFIERFEERIRVNGLDISYEALTRVTLEVRKHAEAMAAECDDHPTEFELMTAVALQYFAESKCDIVVLEVGLGGRLDSTNVIDAPEVAVIARIGLDHTNLLGNTTAEIAGEKAGIIKPGCAVVSWPQDAEAMAVVDEAVRGCGGTVSCPEFSSLSVGEIIHVEEADAAAGQPSVLRSFTYKGVAYTTSLLGSYQPKNAALALEAVFALRSRGWNISDDAVHSGVAAARWAGRFEVLPRVSGQPLIVVDGGHNPQGAQALADSLADVFPARKVVLFSGVMADKNHAAMLATVLPYACAFVAVTPDNPRALPAPEYAAEAKRVVAELADGAELPVYAACDYDDGAKRAGEYAGTDGIICAFGSLYSIHQAKEAFRAAGLIE